MERAEGEKRQNIKQNDVFRNIISIFAASIEIRNMMKKELLFCICFLSCLYTYGQNIVLKAGTLISVECKEEVRAKNVNVGDLISFIVSEDVKIGDSLVISKGNKAFAKVLVAKKSGIAGKKGKLSIEWVYCESNTGKKIPLEGEIDFARKNKTSGAVVAAAVVAVPLIFITGQHAKIPAGYTNVTTVKFDTEL